MSPQLVWLITGTTSGLGRHLAQEVLRRGDKVIATGRARSIAKLDELKNEGADTLELDVTWPLEKLQETAKEAVSIHGRIDVVVNNAGYVQIGVVEETTPKETLKQFNTNVFGALNVSRAFLPYMREKKTGTIIFLGSLAVICGLPYAGLYAASKWALRGISSSLHAEISPLGLRSVCVELGYFRTALLDGDQRTPAISRISDYKELSEKAETGFGAANGKQPGDPLKGVKVFVDLVKGENGTAGKPFPPSLALGSDCYKTCKETSEGYLELLDGWKEVSVSTDFAEKN
ncbi:hypothetical protein CPB83DRAFT_943586 [Crepidotus variabilis]|uniref:Ketoreductase domain-containing protein n=1 Tax=Crepidotus variabilis TaxID=179855 RepID=A0A9P6JM90_9AGAR|nr:hypothetical protein CPB83DRAFT_943586 [Crepidotus variabilis]